MACAAREASEPPVRKLLVQHGKRGVDQAFRLAGRGELEEGTRLDRAAGTRHGRRDSQDIPRRSRENLSAVTSTAAVHVFARLKGASELPWSAQRAQRRRRHRDKEESE